MLCIHVNVLLGVQSGECDRGGSDLLFVSLQSGLQRCPHSPAVPPNDAGRRRLPLLPGDGMYASYRDMLVFVLECCL
jgi:hypothetical protein